MYCHPYNHAAMCQHWVGTGSMLAASAPFWLVYRDTSNVAFNYIFPQEALCSPIFPVNCDTIPRPHGKRRPPTESSAHAALCREMSCDLRKRSLAAVLQERVVRKSDLLCGKCIQLQKCMYGNLISSKIQCTWLILSIGSIS